MFSRARTKRRGKPQPTVVLWWPNGDEPVPEVAGPYSTAEEALEIRNEIRRSQKREKNPAQATTIAKLVFPTPRRGMRRNGARA